MWLDPNSTRGMAVSKEKEHWLGEGIFGLCQQRDHIDVMMLKLPFLAFLSFFIKMYY